MDQVTDRYKDVELADVNGGEYKLNKWYNKLRLNLEYDGRQAAMGNGNIEQIMHALGSSRIRTQMEQLRICNV